MSESTYNEFLEFLFNRNESLGEWRWDIDLDEPDISGESLVSYIIRMFDNYDSDLAQYSDWQLALGLEYIFNNTFSDLSFYLRDGPSSLEKRLQAIHSLKHLYSKCLNFRCRDSLGHLSEVGNPLNNFCYMLWDTTPLSYCEELPDSDALYSAVAEVMEYALSLDNLACIESGLHGLGHLELYYKDAPKIVKKFIKDARVKNSRLLEYAINAESGCIQ
ncbi:hypothetical protein [Microbulbifer sp. JMSA003]|uniref:hypothetical protein n=1 Tax=unclassified Microbulbifer TaxID=2619833 RepID=UPI004039A10D